MVPSTARLLVCAAALACAVPGVGALQAGATGLGAREATSTTADTLVSKNNLPPRLAAHLRTSSGTPLAGLRVHMAAAGQELCIATTDATGTAACAITRDMLGSLLVEHGYKVWFTGTERYAPSGGFGRLKSL